jgi:ABC-type transport system involved in Fe-S cluster assembly fused permease/ATPase subunit
MQVRKGFQEIRVSGAFVLMAYPQIILLDVYTYEFEGETEHILQAQIQTK